MKSKGKAILVALLFGLSLAWTSPVAEAQPPYAKWGKVAMQQTMKTYPKAKIVDYLHVGRKNKTPTTSEETFKLLLQENNRMWALLVHIEFETKTEKVLKVSFEETR